jgi:hypothetical protein
MVVIAVVMGLLTYGLAAALGVWLVRRIHIAPPAGAPGGVLFDSFFKAWVWSIRIFAFLMVVAMVSAPVVFLMRAVR